MLTGAGNGIGRELVRALLARGSTVVACDRDQAALQALQAEFPGRPLLTRVLDITDPAAIQDLAGDLDRSCGGIDGLINCAGIIQPFVRFADTSASLMQRVMEVNLWGTVRMVQAFLPRLAARPEAHVVNISSLGGFFPVPGQTMYGASKAAVRLFTEGLYAECLDSPVRVTVVIPGGVNTNIIEHSGGQPNPRMERLRRVIPLPSPAKVAGKIIRGMERNRFRVLIGLDARLLYLADKVAPRLAIRLATRITAGVLFGK